MKAWRRVFGAVAAVCVCVLGAVGYFGWTMPDSCMVTAGETYHIGRLIDSRAIGDAVSGRAAKETDAALATSGDRYRAMLRLFGVIPIKETTVSVVDEPVVTVCGTPFGIKLFTDGVLIVGMSDVDTAAGFAAPAAAAGVRVGDTIVSVNGSRVGTNEEVAAQINACGGHPITLRIRRDGVEFNATFTPVIPAEGGGYRAGLWVRDSSAGVGMLTFYDAASGVYAGLGHAVCDPDTGEQLTVSEGEVVPARIYDVRKSVKGTPGELRGGFDLGKLGTLLINGNDGLYGTLRTFPVEGQTMPIAMRQEVHTGKATVLTTVTGTHAAAYEVMVEQVRYNASASGHHMVIRVTDEALLSATGGIVQGMSGSPLIQNGKLIGAITHVLVDDPTRGYAIFAENMLETAQGVADSEKLRDAS